MLISRKVLIRFATGWWHNFSKSGAGHAVRVKQTKKNKDRNNVNVKKKRKLQWLPSVKNTWAALYSGRG